MAELVSHLQLSNQIKSLIQTFYSHLSKSQLNNKVRTQIIPLLINLFFQSQTEIIKVSKSQQFLHQLEHSLRQSDKQNIQGRNGQGSEGVNMGKIIPTLSGNIHRNQQIDNMIKKSMCFCKIIQWFTISTKRRQNCIQIFDIHRKCRAKKIKALGWLSKYMRISKIRAALLKFYSNGIKKRHQIDAIRSLHKLYVLKLNKYFFHFTRSIKDQQDGIYGKILKSKYMMIQKGAKLLQHIFSINLRLAMKKVRTEAADKNEWRRVWVNRIALKTKANYQTSFWRLCNFSQNWKKRAEDNEVAGGNPGLKNRLKAGRKQTEAYWMGQKFQSEFFTREQKVLIIWNQIQMIDKSIKLRYTIEAFSLLESFSYSRKSLSPENSFKRFEIEEEQSNLEKDSSKEGSKEKQEGGQIILEQ